MLLYVVKTIYSAPQLPKYPSFSLQRQPPSSVAPYRYRTILPPPLAPPGAILFSRANPYRKVLPSLLPIASRDNHIRFHPLERFFRSE